MTDVPSRNEEDYFHQKDMELIKELRARRVAARKDSERRSHFMKCPKCGFDLKAVRTHHVEVDVCPNCGGMWLDPGELDVLRKVKEYRFGSLFAEIFRSLPGE